MSGMGIRAMQPGMGPEGQHTEIQLQCRTCPHIETVLVPTEAVHRWRRGALIQSVMPELSADQRELIISGTCGVCWDQMFGGEEDE